MLQYKATKDINTPGLDRSTPITLSNNIFQNNILKQTQQTPKIKANQIPSLNKLICRLKLFKLPKLKSIQMPNLL